MTRKRSKNRIRTADSSEMRAKNEQKKAVQTNDAFSNPAARLGFGTFDLLNSTDYPMTRLTEDYKTLTSLYRDNWIVQNIVQLVPQDIIRKWFEVKTAADGEYIDAFERVTRRTHLRDKIKDGMSWGRLYGGAVGLILIKGQGDLSLPLDLDTVLPGTFQGLHILDRWSGVFPEGSIVMDPEDPDFGLPEYYTVRDANETFISRVHHSRIVRFVGRPLPWQEAVTELYWGESEVEAVYTDTVRRDNVAANIAALTFRANVEYREVEGLDQMLGIGNVEMQRRFWNQMAAQAALRSSQGISLINKGDAVHSEQYTFAGLSDIYDRVMMDVAGASRIPVTKLFGRSPAGMNATGESDLINYYDYIDGIRETMLRPVLEKIVPIICMSTWGMIPDDLDIDFPPMQTPDEEKTATIAEKKAGTIIAAFNANLIDKETAAKELRDLEGIFDKITDEMAEEGRGVTAADLLAMRDPFSGMMGADLSSGNEGY